MLKSKKFRVFASSVFLLALTQLLGLDEATAAQLQDGLIKLAGAYLVGQGVADHGKEAAKVAA